MSTINLPLMACEQYMQDNNQSIFDNLVLPEGITKDTLTNNILLQGAEFEVLYADPVFLKTAIGMWSTKMLPTFTKWVEALSYNFNPIENYDRFEEYTKTNTGTVADNGSSSNTGTVTDSGSTSNTGTQQNSGSNTDKVSAFNSDTMRDSTTSTASNTRTDNLASTATNTRTDNLSSTANNTRTDNLSEHNISHIHGNIGVTTSSAMVSEYWRTYEELNIYNQITDLFLTEFCLMVY